MLLRQTILLANQFLLVLDDEEAFADFILSSDKYFLPAPGYHFPATEVTALSNRRIDLVEQFVSIVGPALRDQGRLDEVIERVLAIFVPRQGKNTLMRNACIALDLLAYACELDEARVARFMAEGTPIFDALDGKLDHFIGSTLANARLRMKWLPKISFEERDELVAAAECSSEAVDQFFLALANWLQDKPREKRSNSLPFPEKKAPTIYQALELIVQNGDFHSQYHRMNALYDCLSTHKSTISSRDEVFLSSFREVAKDFSQKSLEQQATLVIQLRLELESQQNISASLHSEQFSM